MCVCVCVCVCVNLEQTEHAMGPNFNFQKYMVKNSISIASCWVCSPLAPRLMGMSGTKPYPYYCVQRD